ncbi:MAG: ABC transporter permease [Planctomycetota bacterium]
MVAYLVRRLLLLVPTLIGISMVTFAIVTMAPGDPAAMNFGDEDSRAALEIQKYLEQHFHLDQPLHVRYALWVWDLLRADLGQSLVDFRPVTAKIKDALWPTLRVNIVALTLAFLISVPIGIVSAARRNGAFDTISSVILYMLFSIPSYVGAIVLIYYLGVRWDLLPFRGMASDDFADLGLSQQLLDMVAHMTLYVLCGMYGSLAFYSRFVRQNLLEVVRLDFIRTARAKGLAEHVVILKHAFRNTLIPFLTLVGLVIPGLLGGAVILEVMFTWPGMGKLFIDSIRQRDYNVVMALSTATALLVLAATLLVDLSYGIVDPRVSHR